MTGNRYSARDITAMAAGILGGMTAVVPATWSRAVAEYGLDIDPGDDATSITIRLENGQMFSVSVVEKQVVESGVDGDGR